MGEELGREKEPGKVLSFEEFRSCENKMGGPRYNNFMMRLQMEDDTCREDEEEAGGFFRRLKKEQSNLLEPLLQKIREYQKIPREELGGEKAIALLGEIEPELYKVYKIMKGYGANEQEDLSFSPE